ncbi:DNA glycosylase family protein [Amycolatopsis thermoflava]|uniref:hypothetical protein n=1 Tax=Amycolatopsis thermoflava TaxID=84480 RepID=UPI0004235587|nr:hypothetical protein [Amycolatopsis thermoflava]
MLVDAVMIDHPAWMPAAEGLLRVVRRRDTVWLLSCRQGSSGCTTDAQPLIGSGERPVLDVLDPSTLTGPDDLVAPLRDAGRVGRWRNPDLWDALATSIVRQVIRAGQARKLYRLFSQTHGQLVDTAYGLLWLFPTAETVLELPEAEFARLGMAFKRRPLQMAAAAYLEHGDKWADLDPLLLRDEVQTVPRIGPWTAGATVADLTNDYALYPFADLAVRTWARRLAPERAWPSSEPEFAAVWRELAGDQLSSWTLLTLAWGVRHANTTGAAAF